jgi:hypothetical protein
MRYGIRPLLCLTILVCTEAALAQTAAYVYVARPTHLDAFAAAADGKLTPVPGSPFANLKLSAMVASNKHLIAVDDDGVDLHTFAIASDGAVKEVSTLSVAKYLPGNCAASYYGSPLTSNVTGSDVYFVATDCEYNGHLLSFRVEADGALQFLGASNYILPVETIEFTPPTFISNDKYAYQAGCSYTTGVQEQQLTNYRRSSSGLLEFVGESASPIPVTPSSPGGVYCPIAAAHSSDHLALALADLDSTSNYTGNTVLATYTASSNGDLTTRSTYQNMPVVPDFYIVAAISISPSGKYLALAGDGVQIYHFNGSSPITHLAAVLPEEYFDQIAWDNKDNVYAHDPQNGYVRVYNVTSTKMKEAPGSPYSIPESTALLVVAK